MAIRLFGALRALKEKRIRFVAERYPMGPVLERYCRDHGVSMDHARRVERELKRYFMLTALHPERPYGMLGPADDLWHTFLWFTRAYHRFSRLMVGRRRFLHHHPGNVAGGDIWPITYDLFWYDYQDAFGEPPPSYVWPRARGPRRSWADYRKEIAAFRAREKPRSDAAGAVGCSMYAGTWWDGSDGNDAGGCSSGCGVSGCSTGGCGGGGH